MSRHRRRPKRVASYLLRAPVRLIRTSRRRHQRPARDQFGPTLFASIQPASRREDGRLEAVRGHAAAWIDRRAQPHQERPPPAISHRWKPGPEMSIILRTRRNGPNHGAKCSQHEPALEMQFARTQCSSGALGVQRVRCQYSFSAQATAPPGRTDRPSQGWPRPCGAQSPGRTPAAPGASPVLIFRSGSGARPGLTGTCQTPPPDRLNRSGTSERARVVRSSPP